MERLTDNKEYIESKEEYERHLAQGYPRNIPKERFLKLCEYEQAEEDGLLKMLPVAIGNDVYFIPSKVNYDLNVLHHHEEFNRVYHQKIARLHFNENGWYAEGNLNVEYGLVDRVFVDKLYKETWFTTEAEAEQALAKMKGE